MQGAVSAPGEVNKRGRHSWNESAPAKKTKTNDVSSGGAKMFVEHKKVAQPSKTKQPRQNW